MYCDRRRNRQKPPRTKPSRQKNPTYKLPPDKPPRAMEREFIQGVFVRIFSTRPTKKSRGFVRGEVCQGVFCLEGFVRGGFCLFLLLSQYICYKSKLNIT